MVRSYTPLAVRASPRAHQQRISQRPGAPQSQWPAVKRPAAGDTRRPADVLLKPAVRSPLAARYALAKSPRARLRATDTNRFFRPRSQLPTIREEDEDEHAAAAAPTARELETSEDEMDWDDEKTLVAMLQEKLPDEDPDSELLALVERLKAPMTAQGQRERQFLLDTLVPVIRRAKDVHVTLDDKVDVEFGTGLLAFDEVCKKTEALAIRDEDELRTAYLGSQNNTKHLLGRLTDAYARRDELWTRLEEDLAQCADRANTALNSLPKDVEQTITRLERKSKELEKDSAAMSKQKMLKGILDKL